MPLGNVATYTKGELAGFLTGLAGQNIIYNIIATGLAFYFQSVIFLPAIACSLIFALARVWDAINDPMMGTIVDKTRTKWGKCKPYLLFVPAVILITAILPFINSMYAEPNQYHEVELQDASAYVEYVQSDLNKEIEYDGVKYVIVPANGTWDLSKDADGGIIKNKVMIYSESDKAAVSDTALATTVLQEFQSEVGFEKKTGGKAALIIGWAALHHRRYSAVGRNKPYDRGSERPRKGAFTCPCRCKCRYDRHNVHNDRPRVPGNVEGARYGRGALAQSGVYHTCGCNDAVCIHPFPGCGICC